MSSASTNYTDSPLVPRTSHGYARSSRSAVSVSTRPATDGHHSGCSKSMSDAQSSLQTASPLLTLCTILGCVQSMEYLDTFLTYYGTAIVCIAIAWLGWRGSQVLRKPTDELASLLGIEVPIAPTLALAGLKADGCLLQWNPVEQKGPAVSYYMTVNGVNVGELSPSDPSLQLFGLQPKHGYVVRIAAKLNNFVNASLPLFIQTKTATTDEYLESQESRTADPGDKTISVSVRPYRAVIDTATSSSHSIPMQREHSGSVSHQQKRNVSARRQTQSSVSSTNNPAELVKDDLAAGEDTMVELTEKLDRLRAETEQCDSLLMTEEAKFHEDQETLTKMLHETQQLLHDRNNATRKLNQHVAALVTEESSARKQKAVLDKQLEKVLQERQRIVDDIAKWASDASKIDDSVEKVSKEQIDYETAADQTITQLKAQFADEKAKNDALEESIRLTIASIREHEDKSRNLVDEDVDSASSNPAIVIDEEENFQRKVFEIQQRCYALNIQQQQLHEALLKDQMNLDSWRQFHLSQAQSYQLPQLEEVMPRRSSGRHGDTLPFAGFDGSNDTAYNVSPHFTNSTPFFNITNGMTLPNENMTMSPTEPDSSFSAVPTSPSMINTFLPSGLFGDDTESKFGAIGQRTTLTRDDSGSQSQNVLPGLGAPGTIDDPPQGSPISQQSQSPIVFASPGASNSNLSFGHASSAIADPDRRSIRSGTGSSRAISGGASGTKFAGIFSIGRQRSKAGSDEGPILGSLRTSQSQSSPRADPASNTSAPSASSKRRGSHSGPSWVGQMLARTNNTASSDDSQKKRFNILGGIKKSDTWSDSNETDSHGLPRPSAETSSRFHWPSSTEELPQPQVANAKNSTWRYSGSGGNWPTQYHSRNSSKLVGHTSDDLGTLGQPVDDHAPGLVITRPQTPTASASRPQTSTPLRLNPNAPTFTGATFGQPPSPRDETTQNGKTVTDRTSNRQSYDGQSLLSVDTGSEPAHRESFDHSISSNTPSENGNPPKESFMRKLTRKGSAGFSTLAGRRAASKKHTVAALATAQAADENNTSDEDTLRSVLTASEDNAKERSAMSPLLGSGGSARGFSLKSLRRKKGDRTPAESVDGDEEDKT